MAGIFQDEKFWRRKIKQENEPPRTARGGGRKACLGSDSDPFPGTYHIKNCSKYSKNKSWHDQFKNQRY